MISFFRRKVPLNIVFWMAIILITIFGHCHGSRSSSQVFNPSSQRNSHQYGHFWNLLPKRIPIPASGPSRKHNDIGLKSTWRLP
ncbi:PREDICTED: protein IDA-LIKE 2-like [Nicotiana attenuata]|uniref:Protein ida-like 2 n=1 Tax=Nicotiana attenuata TaxID=49451 RepID=A0A1J6K0B8_NICAT|nr:PREDICTED: protein IDA-LIKE 2-like [Nicotiana attenuata]OIT22766.1 protein ida-like 2 [Nicotiana attenuata]